MESRNNSARLAAPENSAPATEEPTIPVEATENTENTNKNSLLNFIRPTEFVKLPTGGRFYPEGHALHNQDHIEIHQMTAKEEDILTNRSLVKKGVALDRVVHSLLVSKNINVKDLFLGDKNAVIVAARISAYGAEYKVKISCPECGVSQAHEMDLGDLLATSDEFEIPTGVQMNDRGNFILTLPKTNIVAEVRLLNGHDGIENTRNNKDISLIEMFKKIVVSLNNVTDRKMVNEFLELMPASDSRNLRETYANLVPNIDLTTHFECNACDHEQGMEVPLSADFFWPRS